MNAVAREFVHFGKERLWVDHHAVANDTHHCGMENARRNEPQHELRPVDVDGMARVVTALIARDDVETWSEQVDDLAFTFVAPLSPEHSEIHSQIKNSTLKRFGVTKRTNGALCVAANEHRIAPTEPHDASASRKNAIGFSFDNIRRAF